MAGVAYLHGVEFLPVEQGVRPISVVRSSVIALTGIAPKGRTNELILVQRSADIAQFGLEVPGFTITQSLKAIFANQPTQVMVVNVFDPAVHIAAVAVESATIASGKVRLAFAPIGALTTIFLTDGVTDTGAVLGTDYTINDFGDIIVLNSTLLPDANYKISYNKADLSLITSAEIIGVNGDTRTGMQLFRNAFSTYGYKPKQIIVPGFSALTPVATEMASAAVRYKAVYYLDAPSGVAFSDIQTSRGPAGPIDIFNRGDKRGGLLYPMPTAYDAYTDAEQIRYFSAFFAGLVAFVDANEGYHVSPSNHVIAGIDGMEMPISWDFTDQTGETDANVLNSLGIITIANGVGTGYLAWGNSTSYFPANTTPDQFLCVQRTRDMIEESIAFAMRPFADKPITVAQIDYVLETVNSFLRSLIARGALLPGGFCILDPEQNTTETLQAGQIVFFLDIMPPTPGQRFTFNSYLDTSLLNSLISGQ